MLLLVARSEIEASREAAFNRWYDVHIPVLLRAPAGYENGRRYVARSPGVRHAALYEIRDHSDLPRLYGQDTTLRDPAIAAEWEVWQAEFRPFMSVSEINIYDTGVDSTAPLLVGDYPIVLTQLSPEGVGDVAQLERVWADHLETLLLRMDDVVRVSFVTLSAEPILDWLSMRPSHLLLVHCAGNASAVSMATSGLDVILKKFLTDFEITWENTAYSQVARWWRWPDA